MKDSARVAEEWGFGKKLRKVTKGVDKTGKHKKSLYNMLSNDDSDLDNYDVDVSRSSMKAPKHNKHR